MFAWYRVLGAIVLYKTFNNGSVIPWWSVLLVGKTGAPGENNRPPRKSLTDVIT